MKVTKERVEKNRQALVRAAGRLFRERGIDGVGVAEISKAAGLTHGALYAQFASKDALVAEAFEDGMARRAAAVDRALAEGGSDLETHLAYYLSERHRDGRGTGCAITASASELARQDRDVSERFVDALETMVATVEALLGEAPGAGSRRTRALAIVAGEVGGIVLSRAAAKADGALSTELLAACRDVFGSLAGVRAPATPDVPARAASRTRRKAATTES